MVNPGDWDPVFHAVADYRGQNNNWNLSRLWTREADDLGNHLRTIEPWRGRVHRRINGLTQSIGGLDTKTNNTKNQVDNLLKQIGEHKEDIQSLVGGFRAVDREAKRQTDQIEAQSNILNDVKSRLDDHDKKISNVEEDVKKAKSEIKSGQKALTERMDSNFNDLTELIKKQNGGNGRGNGTNTKQRSAPKGEEDGGGNNSGTPPAQPGGILWYTGPRFLNSSSIGNNNNGLWQGLLNENTNVNTDGGDSIHAPNCSSYVGTKRHDSCHCRSEEPRGPYGLILRPHRRPTLPGLPTIITQPPEYHRRKYRRKSFSVTDASHNWNETPGLSLDFTRDVPGGLFSKPKKERFNIDLGPGGGGGASARDRQGSSERRSSRHEYY